VTGHAQFPEFPPEEGKMSTMKPKEAAAVSTAQALCCIFCAFSGHIAVEGHVFGTLCKLQGCIYNVGVGLQLC
jgi:hypothetical protein